MYSTVQITSEPRMPMGMSLRGSLASWPAVETASKPMYAKNTIMAARMMPSMPYWSSTPVGSGMNGCQLSGFMKNAPTATNAMITETLIATMTLLTVADSDTPRTSSAVTASTMRTAGRLNIEVTTAAAGIDTTVAAGSWAMEPVGTET